ncbi:hypothetical protein QC764_109960 [Podospora pseudoanserina]|uniref:AAA+ ATPase lid domain-containing protein n=1 Tax=Podospora pseudoanserina TaxID=2609844 RepID=A0ABR0IPQ7_9PEZI|nr:hypothetical protein QC764_109960 [Podospora pseudoanserina]
MGKDNAGEEMMNKTRRRSEPWDDLQLPDGHKRLVQSLIESHSDHEGPRSLHFDLERGSPFSYTGCLVLEKHQQLNAKDSKIGPVWNGRRIRNAFRSAVALVGYRSSGGRIKLEREHFEQVSEVSHSETDSAKAERWGYRIDEYRTDETIHLQSQHNHSDNRRPAEGPGHAMFGQMGTAPNVNTPAGSAAPFMHAGFQHFGQQGGGFYNPQPQQPHAAAFPVMTGAAPGPLQQQNQQLGYPMAAPPQHYGAGCGGPTASRSLDFTG